MEIVVALDEKNQRLDLFLTAHMPSLSRSAIQKLIKGGAVTVNEKKVSVHHFLRSGDRVVVVEQTARVQEMAPPPIPIVYEDDDIMVVDKPAGLVVHGGPGITGPTLVDALLAMRPSIASVGDDPKRPGIVHRLDADVSGVLIVAKTDRAFVALKEQFKKRTVKKIYTALVSGAVSRDEATIDFPIGRSRRAGRMAARPAGAEGKDARTHYEVVKRFPNATLVRIEIETGRTHQIRAHFFALGHPIIGDRLYRIKKQHIKTHQSRLLLHATAITFGDMNNNEQTVLSKVPNELMNTPV